MTDLNDNLEELTGAAAGLLIGGKALTAAIGTLTKGLKSGIEFFDKNQKQALQIGRTLTDVNRDVGNSLDRLNASIDKRLTVAIDAMGVGLAGNIDGLNSLTTQQIVLGQNYKNTTRVFSQLQATAGLNNRELSRLGFKLEDLGETYNIKTTDLVDTINSFNSNFTTLNLRGVSSEFVEAAATLQSQVGPQFQGQINRVLNFLGGVSFADLGTLAAMGIGDIRDRIDDAKTSGQMLQVMKYALQEISKTVDGFGDSHYELGGLLGNFNEVVLDAAVLHNATLTAVKEDTNERAKTNALFGNTLEQLMDPLKEIVIEAGPYLSDAAIGLSDVIHGLKEDRVLENIFSKLGVGLGNMINDVHSGFARLITSIQNKFSLFTDNAPPEVLAAKERVGFIEAYRAYSMQGKAPGDLEITDLETRFQALTGGSLNDYFGSAALAADRQLIERGVADVLGPEYFEFFEGLKLAETGAREERVKRERRELEDSENLRAIAENTDPVTNSDFLMTSNDIFTRSMGAILGISGANTSPIEELRDIMASVEVNTRGTAIVGISEPPR